MEPLDTIRERFTRIKPLLNEVQRRYWVAVEAQSLGRGGPARVAAATGVSLPMIRRGLREVQNGIVPDPQRQRRPGGGRKPLLARDHELLPDLLAQLPGEQPAQRRQPLLWVVSSAGLLAEQLIARGHQVSPQSVATLLGQRGYTLRATRAIGSRTTQQQYRNRYQYLSARAAQFIRCGQPVLYLRSYNSSTRNGAERRARADWATPEFTLRAVCSWWQLHTLSVALASELLIALDAEIVASADWKTELRLAARTLGVPIQLCALPPAVHRFRWLQHEATFSSEVALSAQLRSRQTAVVSLVSATDFRPLSALRQKLYRCYPAGLVSATDQQPPWSLCTWPRPR